MDKIILMKDFVEGEGWRNLFPMTLSKAVFNKDGDNIDKIIEDFKNEITDFVEEGLSVAVKKGELIKNLSDYGISPNTGIDVSEKLQSALSEGGTFYFPKGEYILSNPIVINEETKIIGYGVEIEYQNVGQAITFKGSIKDTLSISTTIGSGSISIQLPSATNVKVGDWITLSSNEKATPNARDYDLKKEFNKVIQVSGNTIYLMHPTFFTHSISFQPKVIVYEMLDNSSILGVSVTNKGGLSSQFGIVFDMCTNFIIRDCKSYNFNYSDFEVRESTFGLVDNNRFFTNYSDTLQYGITIHGSYMVNVINNMGGSERTAIDVTRLSMRINVSNNNLIKGGLNTHSCLFSIIKDNQLQCGGMLVRGSNCIITGNIVNSPNVHTVDVQEMGRDEPNFFINNTFNGMFGGRLFTNGTIFRGNKCYATSYNNDRFLMFAQSVGSGGHITIEDNLMITKQIIIPVGLDLQTQTSTINNVRIINNTINNVKVGIQVRPSDNLTTNKNVMISGNHISCTEKGIVFGHCDFINIKDNIIDGSPTVGIEKFYQGTNNRGLVLKDNTIIGANVGIDSGGGTGKVTHSVVNDNVYVNCTENIRGNNFVSQV